MKPSIVVFSVAVLVLGVARASSASECAAATLCERVNGNIDVFTAKVLSEMGDDAAIDVHVVRSFKGSAKGDIRVKVFPAGGIDIPEYDIGQTYLFYTWKENEDGITKRRYFGCGQALELKDVEPEELAFLEHLGSGSQTGEVFGDAKVNATEDPIRDLRIILKGGNKEYSTKTDRKGQFKIAGVAPGIYNIESDGLSDDLMLESSETDFEISPHGCVETLLVAVHNATIVGRVTLPPGFEVEGTAISAFDPDGREVANAYADSDGRYTFAGIASGEYVIGVFAGRFPSTVAKPFRATYAPAATDRAHASKVRIATGTHLKDVDIVVNAATPTATIRVKAKFDDGTPVTNAIFALTDTGDQFGGEHADGSGSAVLEFVPGVRKFLVGWGATEHGIPKCLTPQAVGSETSPDSLELTLSVDGCREQANLGSTNRLRMNHPEPLQPLPIVVLHPSGAPAYRAEVSLYRLSTPFFSGAFQTDSHGHVDLPAPDDGEIKVSASARSTSAPPNPPSQCMSKETVLTRERGLRWRLSSDASAWHDASEPIVLHLAGPDCIQ